MTTLKRQVTAEQLLAAVKQLPEDELRKFERQFQNWQRRSNGGKQKSREKQAETEADLIARIKFNSCLPDTAQRRFNRLRHKLQDETISESELTELQGLWSRVEGMNVERLEALIELARLRGTDVKTLMSEMGLNRRRNVF